MKKLYTMREIDKVFDCAHAVYSMGDVESYLSEGGYTIRVDIDEVPIKGTVKLCHEGSWGAKRFEEEVTDPTLYDIMKVFDRAIVAVNDYHHVFLEGLHNKGDGRVYFRTGS